jgi:transposase
MTTGSARSCCDNSLVVRGCWQIGYDADWIRAFVAERGAWANIPPKRNRKDPICFSPYLYRDRNLIERFFNKIKQCRRGAFSPSSSSPASAYGCAFMSARPSQPRREPCPFWRRTDNCADLE